MFFTQAVCLYIKALAPVQFQHPDLMRGQKYGGANTDRISRKQGNTSNSGDGERWVGGPKEGKWRKRGRGGKTTKEQLKLLTEYESS